MLGSAASNSTLFCIHVGGSIEQKIYVYSRLTYKKLIDAKCVYLVLYSIISLSLRTLRTWRFTVHMHTATSQDYCGPSMVLQIFLLCFLNFFLYVLALL